ncbi:OX-2 membrane glycoprotein-like isoform X2 [Pyxicephalus adspersus]|uniref:OX-2 membrane glycoprotein-like isoform X2 n=1 Tax=Pyxicephalus adspersus TaxID=30357 RepID=UPI003B5A2709
MQNIFSVCSMPYRMCLLVALFLSLLAITVSGYQVKCQNTSLPVLGEDVTLTCEFQAHQDVLQVTWQKKRGENTQNMATYSEIYGTNIVKLFENHVSLINASSRNSTIKIFKLKTEDEACYVCLFNVYPNGAIKGEVCLTDLRLPPNPDPTKTVDVKEHNIGGSNTDDPEMQKKKQQRFLDGILMVITGIMMVLMVMGLAILHSYEAHRKKTQTVHQGKKIRNRFLDSQLVQEIYNLKHPPA